MAKSKKRKANGVVSLLPVIAAFFGLIAIVTIFMPVIAQKDSDNTINGIKAVFGYSETTGIGSLSVSAKVLNFSFLNFLAYLLVLVGTVFSVLSFLKGGNKLFALIAAACFVGAAILFFCFVANAGWLDNMKKSWELLKKTAGDFYELAIGSILGAICSIIAAVVSAASLVLKK